MPGYLSWFGLKQILWISSVVTNFIYHNICSNVGVSIILYSLFAHFLLSPFSLKKFFDRRRSRKAKEKEEKLKSEFFSLPEEERNKEEVKEKFKEEYDKIKKGKSSRQVGCLVMILRFFVVMASTPVIHYFEYYVNPTPESYMFLGFDLSSPGPGFTLHINAIIPVITCLILLIPGYISTWKNLKDREIAKANKSEEEKEEEARMLKEMGIKEGSKFSLAWVMQIVFTFIYFKTFLKLNLTVSLFWGVYYLFGIGIRRLLNFVFTKTNH